MVERLNIHGLRWRIYYNEDSSLLKLSKFLPICYQLIERDIRVFTAIKQLESHIFRQTFQVGLTSLRPTHY